MRRHRFLLLALLLSLLAAPALTVHLPAAHAAPSPAQAAVSQVFLPLIGGLPALPPVDWDPRLDQRGATLIPTDVEPGHGYWRLVKAVWYGPEEPPFAGMHHIFVDTRDAAGDRRPGVPVEITSLDRSTLWATVVTEAKPGDLYAGNFPMYALAPAYRAMPADGNPADAVSGMGLGSIEHPDYTYHTSYGLVWQWTIARR